MPGPGSYWFGEEEKKEVLDVLESGYLFRYGSFDDPRFRHKAYDLRTGIRAVLRGGSRLADQFRHQRLLVALMGVGLRPGDEVIVPAYTFVASYSAIIFAGGVPVLAEIDDSLTIDPEDIERRITPRTRAIMPVHMLGNPSQMEAIMAIAAQARPAGRRRRLPGGGRFVPRAKAGEHRPGGGLLAERLQDDHRRRRRRHGYTATTRFTSGPSAPTIRDTSRCGRGSRSASGASWG